MSHPHSEKSALVVSAHSADFVWRCGGAIALHAEKGWKVRDVYSALADAKLHSLEHYNAVFKKVVDNYPPTGQERGEALAADRGIP